MLFFRKRKSTDRKQGKQFNHVGKQATLARLRPLRCEPLEDRRMLSITLFVDDSSTATTPDGLAWGTAYNDLQSALTQAATLNTDGDTTNDVDAIWIAEGTYTPSAELEAGDARSASFSLVDGVTLYGGFAGTEMELSARDWINHETILSGDLGVLDDISDNAYTLVYCDASIEAAFDGLVITDGNASGYSATNDSARSGGGVYNDGTLKITNSIISNNSARMGGGIQSNVGTILNVVNSTISNNSANQNGGGICSRGILTVTGSTISDNSSDVWGGGINGGLYDDEVTLVVTDSIISGNTASYDGGGIYGIHTLTITGSTISDNSAGSNGGGIYNAKELTFTDSTLSGNLSAGLGGGIYATSWGGPVTTMIENSVIANNTSDTNGGGIYSNASYDDTALLTITNSTLSGNSTNGSGGGIYNYAYQYNGTALLAITDSIFSDNSAGETFDSRGGGIYNNTRYSSSALTLTGSTFSGNTARSGGGIASTGVLILVNSTMSNNSAFSTGGGITCTGDLTLTNSTLSGNSAAYGGGLSYNGDLTLVNSTLTNNSAVSTGGGIRILGEESTATLNNTVVAGNTAPSGPDIDNDDEAVMVGSHNLIGDGTGQALVHGVNDNIIGTSMDPIDPLLGPLQDNGGPTLTHAPLPGSSLIDAGSNVAATSQFGWSLMTDQRGFLRAYGNIDIGAVEVQPVGIPVAYDDLFELDQDGSIVFETADILANDISTDGNSLTAEILAAPEHGKLTFNPNGTMTYTPEATFWGIDTISYHAVNGSLGSNVAELVFSVISPQSVIVTTAIDEQDGNLAADDISLREALLNLSASQVQFSADLYKHVIDLTMINALPLNEVQIVGLGAQNLAVRGNANYPAFEARYSNSTISNLMVTGSDGYYVRYAGVSVNSGTTLQMDHTLISGNQNGGINNKGTLTITNSTITNNSASDSNGGGILNSGILTIIDSTIANNSANSGGGGIYNSGILTITNTTIVNNSANSSGGGIFNTYSGTVTLTNSTLSGNSARNDNGGGICNSSGTLMMTSSTITGNSANSSGGGIHNDDGNITLNNTIVAGNTAYNGPDISRNDGTLSGSFNLIGNRGIYLLFEGANDQGNIVGTPENPVNPMLGTLRDNGGPTLTHAPLPGSPLIDAGSNQLASNAWGSPILTDQRGLARTYGTVDIGAVETQPQGVPIAYPDGFQLDQTDSLSFDLSDLLVNDICSDGSSLTATVLTDPEHGTLTVNLDGSCTYTPEETFWGNDSFSYKVANGSLESNVTEVILSVLSPESVLVTTADDEIDGDLSPDDVSLREALADDTTSQIQFDIGLFGQTIKLNMGTLVASDVQIVGLGTEHLAVDGQRQSTVFHTQGTTLISHLFITGGLASSGGGIYNDGTLTLMGSLLSGNSASSGGGIYSDGTLALIDSTLSRNSASNGGGIYNDGGTMAVTDTTFMNNLTYRIGGGIFNDGGILTLTDSTFIGNSTGLSGGGIYNSGSTLTINGSTFADNLANSSGGGICNYGGTVVLTNSTFIGNSADGTPFSSSSRSGGGIYNSTGTVTLANSTLVGNSANSDHARGGGIYNSKGAVTLTNSTLAGNSANGNYSSGGGIYCYGSLTLNNSIVSLNESLNDANIYNTSDDWSKTTSLVGLDPQFVRSPSAGADGTWRTGDDDYGDLRLTGISPAINTGSNSHAVDAQGNPLTTDADGQPRFDSHSGIVDIGAYEYQDVPSVERDEPSLVVTSLLDTADPCDGVITLREAIFYASSGIDTLGDEITFDLALFTGGTGRISMTMGQFEIWNDLAITGPEDAILTLDAGGAGRVFFVCGEETDATLSHLTITGGLVDDGNGGGIYNAKSTLTVSDSVILGNTANGSGGGIGNYGGILTVTSSILVGNSTSHSGGGIYSDDNATLTVTSSTITGNSADGTNGDGISSDSTFTINNSIVTLNGIDNEAELLGVWSGTANLIGIDPQFIRDPSAGADGTWGTDDDDFGDLRLTDVSPAINAGSNSHAVDAQGNPLTTDADGQPRFDSHSGIIDIGAYEYQDVPSIERDQPSLIVTSLLDTADPCDGVITLREAIFYASSGIDTLGDEITFDPALFTEGTGRISMTMGQFEIWNDLAITGPENAILTLDAGGAGRVFFVCGEETDATLSHLTITGGLVDDGNGGGIYNTKSTLTVTDSAILGNTANGSGGGIGNYSGILTVTSSILVGNLSDSSYYRSGSAISNYDEGTLTVTSSTITGNSVIGEYGSAIRNKSGTFTINNSIVALNRTDNEAELTGGWAGTANLTGNDPQFVRNPSAGADGTWGTDDDDYGDLRLTAVSPAVNTGANSLAVDAQGYTLTTDLAGQPRFDSHSGIVDIGAYEYHDVPDPGRETASLTVTSLLDTVDLFDDMITLREAIFYSGIDTLGNEITFAPSLFTEKEETILLTMGQFEIRSDLAITGPDDATLRLDAGGASRVFYIYGNETDASLSNLAITNGSANSGGGIFTSMSTLTVTNSTITGNSTSYNAGGIYNFLGSLTLNNSTIVGNVASNGGGIYSTSGSVILNNSTIAGNSADRGGGIYDYHSSLTFNNTIIALNEANSDVNISTTDPYSGTANLIDTDPLFVRNPSHGNDGWGDDPETYRDESANDDYGDLRLRVSSPAVDAGDNSLIPDGITTDLGGNPRIVGGTVDIGAYEYALIPGDANGDSRVDGSDVTILAANWQHGVTGTPDATWNMGDFNYDGKVDGSDVTILASNWQAGVSSAVVAVSGPEEKEEVTPTTHFTPPTDASLGIATVPQRESLLPRRFITTTPEATDAVLAESTWTEIDYAAIAKDLTLQTAKKSTAASDEFFTLELDPYGDQE